MEVLDPAGDVADAVATPPAVLKAEAGEEPFWQVTLEEIVAVLESVKSAHLKVTSQYQYKHIIPGRSIPGTIRRLRHRKRSLVHYQ